MGVTSVTHIWQEEGGNATVLILNLRRKCWNKPSVCTTGAYQLLSKHCWINFIAVLVNLIISSSSSWIKSLRKHLTVVWVSYTPLQSFVWADEWDLSRDRLTGCCWLFDVLCLNRTGKWLWSVILYRLHIVFYECCFKLYDNLFCLLPTSNVGSSCSEAGTHNSATVTMTKQLFFFFFLKIRPWYLVIIMVGWWRLLMRAEFGSLTLTSRSKAFH